MKRALTVLGALAILALSVTTALAQPRGGARGRVVDENGEPVADAKVLLENTDDGTSKYEVETNDKGNYVQIGLPPGAYHFTASKEGYVAAALDIRVTLGDLTSIPNLELVSEAAARAMHGPDNAEVQAKFNEGVALAQDNKLDEAKALFEEVLELQPGIPEVYRNLGWIATQQQDWEAAENHFLSALDLRPEDPSFAASLAEVYRKTGRRDEAMALINQTAGDNPEDAKSQFNRGLFLLDGGESAEAAEAFEAALAADPEMAEAHYHLGTILVGQGKVDESVQHLEAYLAASPDNEEYVATAQGLIAALQAQ